jgi:hypothetical protein
VLDVRDNAQAVPMARDTRSVSAIFAFSNMVSARQMVCTVVRCSDLLNARKDANKLSVSKEEQRMRIWLTVMALSTEIDRSSKTSAVTVSVSHHFRCLARE